jgi:hypothetical protein
MAVAVVAGLIRACTDGEEIDRADAGRAGGD